MAIFKTTDFNAAKSDKVRAAVGRKLGKAYGVPATSNEVDDYLTQAMRDLVQADDEAAYMAAKPEPDQL